MKLWSWLLLRLLFQIKWLLNTQVGDDRLTQPLLKAGSTLRPGQGAQGFVLLGLKYFQRWRLHTLFKPSAPVPPSLIEKIQYLLCQYLFKSTASQWLRLLKFCQSDMVYLHYFHYLPSCLLNFSSSFSGLHIEIALNFISLAPSSHWKSLSLTFWFSFNLRLFIYLFHFKETFWQVSSVNLVIDIFITV